MIYINAVSLNLLYCAIKSRQKNSAFFVEACIWKIIEFAVMPIPGSHSWIFYSWFYIPSVEENNKQHFSPFQFNKNFAFSINK